MHGSIKLENVSLSNPSYRDRQDKEMLFGNDNTTRIHLSPFKQQDDSLGLD